MRGKRKYADGPEWVVEFDDRDAISELRLRLRASEAVDRPVVPTRGPSVPFSPYLVDRFQGLKVEVFANEHPPPHFRVKCGGETANYRISDCHQLNGGLIKHQRTIKQWHAKNRDRLIKKWNEARPTGCPVGDYRD